MDWKQKYYGELFHHGKKGQKWGVRRYQNEDGSLTEAGKKRYARDVKGLSKKKRDQYEVDADKWVTEDMERSKRLADAGSNMAGTLGRAVKGDGQRKKVKMDLSKMSDQEMRNRINRELLERQYNDMFAPEKKAKGKEAVTKILETIGTTTAIVSSGLGIALAIKELKG